MKATKILWSGPQLVISPYLPRYATMQTCKAVVSDDIHTMTWVDETFLGELSSSHLPAYSMASLKNGKVFPTNNQQGVYLRRPGTQLNRTRASDPIQ